jgi:hypothetical protein
LENIWWHYLVWVLAATLLGGALSALFAGWLHLPRRIFLVIYTVCAGVFMIAFARWSAINLLALILQNWAWGMIVGAITAAYLVVKVRSQPNSQGLRGGMLFFDLGWLGLVYGLMDALFLNVIPVLATWAAFSRLGWTESWLGMVATGLLALLASLLVTAVYHLGYPEFRNARLGLVLFGNSMITLAYILPGNPLGAMISHITMHIAAVLQGPETTIQLPPHYSRAVEQM